VLNLKPDILKIALSLPKVLKVDVQIQLAIGCVLDQKKGLVISILGVIFLTVRHYVALFSNRTFDLSQYTFFTIVRGF
jgi:hypothetical protein